MLQTLRVVSEVFPLANPFVISRGARTEAVVIVASITRGGFIGRGECVPYARYGESIDSVTAQIESVRPKIEAGADRFDLAKLLPAGAARNALDCALFDLEAKQLGMRAWALAGLHRLSPVTTTFTISAGPVEQMARDAALQAHRPILKIKLCGQGDVERIRAVREAAQDCVLIADGNEGCREEDLVPLLDACLECGVALLEQPLPAGRDELLAHIDRKAPICADESVHDRAGLAELRNRYDLINVKLDKTGGLTEALALVDEAQALGFGVMIGCMVATSLAMAPALVLTPKARFVDLDGPLLLAHDRPHGLVYEGATLFPPTPELWG